MIQVTLLNSLTSAYTPDDYQGAVCLEGQVKVLSESDLPGIFRTMLNLRRCLPLTRTSHEEGKI